MTVSNPTNTHIVRPLLLLLLLLSILSAGCATRYVFEGAVGESAIYRVRLIDADTPRPLLYWQESPRFFATALRLSPPVDSCNQVEVYANRHPARPLQLSASAQGVSPVDLISEADEMAYWQNIMRPECALLVTFGTLRKDLFTGLSLSTQTGVVRRERAPIQGRVGAQFSNPWMFMFAGIFDITKSPLYVLAGTTAASADGPTEPVTVIFDFPGGRREQAALTADEVTTLLRRHDPDVLTVPPYPLKRARPWVRAALAKLRLEFVEKAAGDILQDEWLPESLELVMVEGYRLSWVYRVDTHAEYFKDLTYWIGDASSLRFSIQD